MKYDLFLHKRSHVLNEKQKKNFLILFIVIKEDYEDYVGSFNGSKTLRVELIKCAFTSFVYRYTLLRFNLFF